ncbi:MAG: glycoside hydrolase family 3 C-terminal domain-containing protein [Polyangiales bacterium]
MSATAVVSALGCSTSSDQLTPAVEAYCRDHDARDVERRIDRVLAELTLEEKADLMRGTFPLPRAGTWQAAILPAKGFPGFHMLDGPRGVSRLGGATGTAFPVAMARGATWDPELEAEVGRAIGTELRARGADTLLAPTVNLLQHPLWGRAQETYGEDSFHVGALGTGFVLGAQEQVPCVVKHFAVNNIEDTRLTVNVEVSERALREVFLPHFQRIVSEGRVAGVMTAYNRVNGEYCSQNRHLLSDILRDDWGYAGLVMSDWVWGTHDTVPAIEAGLDLEMPAEVIYGEPLVEAVQAGDVRERQLDTALRRILRAQYCYSFDTNPPVLDDDAVETEETLALARRVATQGIVLLENDGALPMARTAGTDIVVVGQLADVENIGDQGSSAVRPTSVVTALEGLVAAAGDATVTHVPGDLSDAGDQATVTAADVVVVVVGLDTNSEGEGNIAAGDRASLALPAEHLALVQQAATLSDNVVVVLEGGSVLDVGPFVDDVEALLMAWYPGSEGGHAIASVLFGDHNPTGRVPMAWPYALADLPAFDSVSEEVTQGLFHGQRHLDREGTQARYPLGYGLSYTDYAYESLTLSRMAARADDVLQVTVRVRNTGARDGAEVVQVYVRTPGNAVPRPVRELRGFARVDLPAGEGRDVVVELPIADLLYYDEAGARWVIEPGTYRVEVGPNAGERPLEASFEVAN